MDFQPIRPTCLRLEWPAIPTTNVAKRMGAIIVFIRRRKILLRTERFWAKWGKFSPTSIPTIILTKIHVVSDGRGRPLVTRATAGQAADTTTLLGLVDAVRVARSGGVGRPRVRPDYLVADKDYSSRANRAGLHARRIAHTIPERDDQRPSPAAGPSRWPAGGVLPSAVSASQPGRARLCPAQATAGGGNPLRQAQAPL